MHITLKRQFIKTLIGSNNYTEKSSGTANPFFGGLQKLDHILPGLAAGFAVYVTDNEFKEQDDLIENVELSSTYELIEIKGLLIIEVRNPRYCRCSCKEV